MSAKEVTADQPIDVNRASVESLSGVTGLGPILAGRIVAYREEHGPFTNLSELTNVRGIGPRLLARIAGQIKVGEENSPPVHEAIGQGDSSEVRDSGIREMAEERTTPERVLEKREPFWQRLLWVSLGGLLGMVLTLLVMFIVSGTLHFAPQREVVALSHNLATTRSEQERAWQRIERLTERADELERQMRRLEGLREQVADLQRDLTALRADARELERAFEALRSEVSQELSSLNQHVTEMQNTVQRVQERVRRFDAFFASLRDLLDELNISSGSDKPSTPEG
jgi:competence ComEA-like helix-hairpin-helix protein